jgi:hypothetical protein
MFLQQLATRGIARPGCNTNTEQSRLMADRVACDRAGSFAVRNPDVLDLGGVPQEIFALALLVVVQSW